MKINEYVRLVLEQVPVGTDVGFVVNVDTFGNVASAGFPSAEIRFEVTKDDYVDFDVLWGKAREKEKNAD